MAIFHSYVKLPEGTPENIPKTGRFNTVRPRWLAAAAADWPLPKRGFLKGIADERKRKVKLWDFRSNLDAFFF